MWDRQKNETMNCFIGALVHGRVSHKKMSKRFFYFTLLNKLLIEPKQKYCNLNTRSKFFQCQIPF